jgi:THAP4-like, heme-binding beta-barrel domain
VSDDDPLGDLAAAFETPFIPDAAVPVLHPALEPLAFLLGTWRGVGVGGYPTIESFRFGQEIVFGHAGKPVLTYVSRSWVLDDAGNVLRAGAAESGFWRVDAEGGGAGAGGAVGLEIVLAHASGFAEIWIGNLAFGRIEMSTDVVARTASAKEVTAGHRLYGMVDGDLLYAYDMAAVGQPLGPHLSARLTQAS